MAQERGASSPIGASSIWGGVDTLRLQFQFNYWAYERIFTQMAKLTEAELKQPNTTTHDTAFQLLLHAVDTHWSWRIVCQEGYFTRVLWEVEDLPDLASIVRFWDRDHRELLAYLDGLSDADLDRDIDIGALQGNPSKVVKVIHLISHFLFHSNTHRAELAIYLTACGHSPGDMEPLDYILSRPS